MQYRTAGSDGNVFGLVFSDLNSVSPHNEELI